MSPIAKQEYSESVAPRYKKAPKWQKTIILNHYCEVTEYHRNHAIRKLNHCLDKKKKRKPGRPSVYNQDFIVKPLRKIWKASEFPCSIRLKVIVQEWLPFMEDDLHPTVKRKLFRISPATIDRILRPYRTGRRRRMYCRTKPGKLLKTRIPIKTDQWNEKQPGFLEADTVALCGGSFLGDFVHALDVVDIATGWAEQRASFGKSKHSIVNQIKDIEASLPFKLKGFDSDSGNEFLNKTLIKYFTHRPHDPVQFTRSRPYHKDDNAHIEQKNWTHVRQWFGYYRFDNPAVVRLMNDLFKNEWRLYHNFFLPSVKLVAKERIGSRIIKRHDTPKTPFKRLLASRCVDPEIKQYLKAQYKQLNPFKLRQAIEQKLNKIFALRRLKIPSFCTPLQ
jgi:hypothetical protein